MSADSTKQIEVLERTTTRLEALLAVSADLLRHTSEHEVADAVIHAGIDTLGASSAGLWLLAPDAEHLVLEHHIGFEDAVRERVGTLALEDPRHGAVVESAVSGHPVFIASHDEYARRFPNAPPPTGAMGTAGAACLPLIVEGRLIGCLCFNFDEANAFTTEERGFLELLSRHAAQALDRARLLEAEHRARRAAEAAAADTHTLYRLTEAMNRVESVEQVYALAVDAIARGVDVRRAAILVFDDAGVMRFVSSRGLSQEYRAAVEGHSPWTPDSVDPEPVVVDDTELDPAWAKYLPVFRAEGIRALGFVPIVHQGGLLGKFMLYSDVPRHFGERELGIAAAVASHVAHAVERSRAQERERRARVEAEEASRAREEILSVVSHDLRNPLSAILMAAGSLLRTEMGDPRAQRVRAHAERIHRNVERMTRLIEDLVDFSAIRTGQFALKRADHAPDAIVRAAVDMFATLAEQRGMRVDALVDAPMPLVSCDHDRVVQAISNLVSNAMKVMGPGGLITISSVLREREIQFAVRDTGPGIKAEELPYLFERYWRSSSASYKGTGLGLSIAKGIVEAHGGRIWAESTEGSGSTFSFAIPGVILD